MKGKTVNIAQVKVTKDSVSIVTRFDEVVTKITDTTLRTQNQKYPIKNGKIGDFFVAHNKNEIRATLVASLTDNTGQRVADFLKGTLWNDQTQSVEFCKQAKSQGAKIQRKERHYFSSHSGQSDCQSVVFVESTKPNWTAQDGYRVDPACSWWQELKAKEFYEERL